MREYERTYAYMQSAMDCTHVPEEAVRSLAALKAAIQKICSDTGCSRGGHPVLDGRCRMLLGIMPCCGKWDSFRRGAAGDL